MFLEYYGLREQPFGVTPDPRFLYFGAGHREALSSLFYGIESGCGFLSLIAPPGMGKTTLLLHLLEKLRGSAQTVFLFQTQCGSREMFRHLLNDLGIDSKDQDLASMHESLNSVLLSNARKGRRVVLVIDEAQNLKDSVLETIRLLSDFETPQAKLLQIVLSGQPQLADKLSQPGLTQLRQRISLISRLQPLTRVETLVYLEYRLCRAGYSGPPLFSYAAADLIAASSKGVPRTINNLCFNALTLGYAKRQKQVDVTTVREVLADLDLEGFGTHVWAVPEGPDDPRASFDGLVPSNDLTYLDFHDAVKSAWGNGPPIKNEGNHVQDSVNWSSPNGNSRPEDASFRMSPRAEGSSSSTLELENPQVKDKDGSSGYLQTSVASTQARQEGIQREQNPTPVAITKAVELLAEPFTHKTQTAQPKNRNTFHGSVTQLTMPSPSPLSSSKRKRGFGGLWEVWRGLFWNAQDIYKEETGTAVKSRAIRGGAVVGVIFALTAIGAAFAKHNHESSQATLQELPAASAPGSAAPAQPPASLESQGSQVPPFNANPATAKLEDKPVVVTAEHGQMLSEVSLHYLGQFNPKVTREIQMANPKINDSDLVHKGTQIPLPNPSAHADINTPSRGEALNHAEEK
jgi:general secretion pathway protein A